MKMAIAFALILGLACTTARAAESACEQDAKNVAQAVVAYTYLVKMHSPEFPRQLDDSPKFPELRALQSSLEKVDPTLATSLIFVRNQYIVRGDAANRKSGSESRLREKGQQESTLFVTTPIAKYGNRSVLILSSVSPLRVRAFAINGCMDISALYDSRDAKSENLAPITDVAIASNGEVLLLQAGSSRSVLKVPGPN